MTTELESKQEAEKENHNCDGPVAEQGWARLRVNKLSSNAGFEVEGYLTVYKCLKCKNLFGMINDSKVRI